MMLNRSRNALRSALGSRGVMCGLTVFLVLQSGCEEMGLKSPSGAVPGTTETPVNVAPEVPSVPPVVTPAPLPTAEMQSPEQFVAELVTRTGLNVSDADLIKLAEIGPANAAVTELNLKASPVTQLGLSQLAKLPALRKVSLAACPLVGNAWSGISSATQLEELDAEGSGLDDSAMPALASLVNLKTLNLGHTPVSDNGLQHLAGMTKLESFNCNYGQITGSGFEVFTRKFANAPLRHINVGNTTFGSHGFDHLGEFKSLETFIAGFAGITDDKLTVLKGFKDLKVLVLGGNAVSDQGLKFLPSLDHLETLDIGDTTQVSDYTLERIKKQKALRVVRVDNTSCTLAGVQALNNLLPECTIRFQGAEF